MEKKNYVEPAIEIIEVQIEKGYAAKVAEPEYGGSRAGLKFSIKSVTPDNNIGITGIAPNVEIITIKAECDEKGNFKRISDLVFGLYYAIER